MRHLLLIGEHDLTIDDKNRLLVPAEIRKSLDPERDGQAFFVVPGMNKKPWLYPENVYLSLVSRFEEDITPGEEQLDFAHANFALAVRIEWDSQGRVLIPEKVLRRAEMIKDGTVTRDVTLIGAGNHAELWSRADWSARLVDVLARHKDIAINEKKTRQPPGTGSNGNGNGRMRRDDDGPPPRSL